MTSDTGNDVIMTLHKSVCTCVGSSAPLLHENRLVLLNDGLMLVTGCYCKVFGFSSQPVIQSPGAGRWSDGADLWYQKFCLFVAKWCQVFMKFGQTQQIYHDWYSLIHFQKLKVNASPLPTEPLQALYDPVDGDRAKLLGNRGSTQNDVVDRSIMVITRLVNDG